MAILPAQRAWGALDGRQPPALRGGGAERCLRDGRNRGIGRDRGDDTLVRAPIWRCTRRRHCQPARSSSRHGARSATRRSGADDLAERRHTSSCIAAALAQAVDAKDAGTRNHCELSGPERPDRRTARAGGQRLEQLRVAGLLHDVGKIGIADSILQKPRPARPRTSGGHAHARELGHSIVSATELEEEAGWVLHHHERFDGAGYPTGSTGDDIPLESRIIFVADAFEAMTADRPYRAGRSPEAALDELAAHAGTQFDPLCVGALCSIFEHLPEGADEVELEERDEVAVRRDARARRAALLRGRRDEDALKSPNASADR